MGSTPRMERRWVDKNVLIYYLIQWCINQDVYKHQLIDQWIDTLGRTEWNKKNACIYSSFSVAIELMFILFLHFYFR